MSVLIRSTVLAGFRELAAQHGGDAGALLSRFGLLDADPESPTTLVPYHAVVRLFETAARQLDCPNLGVQLSRYQSLDKLGPMALLAMNCQRVEAAIRTVTAHVHTYTPAVMLDWTCAAGEPPTLHYNVDVSLASITSHPQMTEFSLAFAVQGLRLLAGKDFQPEAVLFRHHSPLPASAYRGDFGVAPMFGQEINALHLSPHWLEKPVNLADDRLRDAIDHYLEPLIDNAPLLIDKQVEHLIARLLPTGQCSVKTVANQLAMHPRTLQRKLELSGRHFEEMVDYRRRNHVLEMLGDARIPLSQVAGLVGYSEQSTLTRSCRRWFGSTPIELRRRIMKEAHMDRAAEKS